MWFPDTGRNSSKALRHQAHREQPRGSRGSRGSGPDLRHIKPEEQTMCPIDLKTSPAAGSHCAVSPRPRPEVNPKVEAHLPTQPPRTDPHSANAQSQSRTQKGLCARSCHGRRNHGGQIETPPPDPTLSTSAPASARPVTATARCWPCSERDPLRGARREYTFQAATFISRASITSKVSQRRCRALALKFIVNMMVAQSHSDCVGHVTVNPLKNRKEW